MEVLDILVVDDDEPYNPGHSSLWDVGPPRSPICHCPLVATKVVIHDPEKTTGLLDNSDSMESHGDQPWTCSPKDTHEPWLV